VFCRLGEDWRNKCKRRIFPPAKAGPLTHELIARYLLEKLYCPACGALLDSDMVEETSARDGTVKRLEPTDSRGRIMSFPGQEYKASTVKTLRVRLWKDLIAVIREPKFVEARTASYPSDDDWVVGVEGKNEVKAYPIKVLAWRHIVNDHLDGRPIAVTYSSLCRSVVVFETGTVSGAHVFGVAGLNIAASNLAMYDDETLSLWNQLLAEALWGKLTGTTLVKVPFLILKFREWKSLYPDGRVLSSDLGLQYDYSSYPTAMMMREFAETWEEYERSENLPNPVPGLDTRLHPKTPLLTVNYDDIVKVYPYSECYKARAVNDVVAGRSLVILFASEKNQTPAAYLRRLDDRELTFRAEASTIDEETGSTWNIAGTAVDGKLKGKKLTPIAATHCLWFGWWATYPDSVIYTAAPG
jgi:hypothetical protein